MKKPLRSVVLPDNWYSLKIRQGANRGIDGLYKWTIVGVGSYIGQYKITKSSNFSKRIKLYDRNVSNLLNGRPYRKSKPDGFRYIHHALADAVRSGKRKIILEILENVPPGEELNRREKELTRKHRCNLNGSVPSNFKPKH